MEKNNVLSKSWLVYFVVNKGSMQETMLMGAFSSRDRDVT